MRALRWIFSLPVVGCRLRALWVRCIIPHYRWMRWDESAQDWRL